MKENYSKKIIDTEGYKMNISKFTKNVTFKLQDNMSDVFENPTYCKFFKMLKNISYELDEKLQFDVEIDYVTLEAFKLYISSNGYKNLYNNIGTRIFELINDLSIQGFCFTPKDIAKRFLNNTDLIQLKEFYNSNEDTVYKSFKNGYSSLYLYEMIYKEKNHNCLLANLYSIIQDKKQPNQKRDFVSNLLIEFENELLKLTTENSRNNLCYCILKINDNIDKVNYLKYINRNDFTIESIYDDIN